MFAIIVNGKLRNKYDLYLDNEHEKIYDNIKSLINKEDDIYYNIYQLLIDNPSIKEEITSLIEKLHEYQKVAHLEFYNKALLIDKPIFLLMGYSSLDIELFEKLKNHHNIIHIDYDDYTKLEICENFNIFVYNNHSLLKYKRAMLNLNTIDSLSEISKILKITQNDIEFRKNNPDMIADKIDHDYIIEKSKIIIRKLKIKEISKWKTV